MRHQERLQEIYARYFINCFREDLHVHKTPIGSAIQSYDPYDNDVTGLIEFNSTIFIYNSRIETLYTTKTDKFYQFFDWIKYRWVIVSELNQDFCYVRDNNWSFDGVHFSIKMDNKEHHIRDWEGLKKFIS